MVFINAEVFNNTENRARKIIANAEAGADVTTLVAELVATKNPDGGFGELSGFNSTPLDTAFALEALVVAGAAEVEVVTAAVNFLGAKQNSDGGFSLSSSVPSSIYITALVIPMLQKFLADAGQQSIDAANDFLFGHQSSGGGWETGLALLAVVSSTLDATRYAPALDALRARQLTDGSWGNDVYATALVLRALDLAENIKFTVDPSGGTITGRVVDANTGLSLIGTTVSVAQLAGSQINTEIDGRFTLTGVPPGAYTINYQAAGYSDASRTAKVVAGQLVHLGTVNLIPLADVGVITGTITNAATGQPIADALVQVLGATTVSVITDATGFFRIATGPGPVTLTVAAAGFDSISSVGTVTAGANLIFSPALFSTGTTPPGQNITVRGKIVDAVTQEPLAGVVVSIAGTGSSTTSDLAGTFSLLNTMAVELTVNLTKSGYRSVSLTTAVAAGMTIDLGLISLPRAAEQTTSAVVGKVIDAATGEAIAGATVTLGVNGQSATTAADGSYRIQDITLLNFDLTSSATGYLSASTLLSLAEPAEVIVDFALTSASVGGISVTSLLTDQFTYPALSPVTITGTVSNSGPVARSLQLFVVVTDSVGNVLERFPATGSAAGAPEAVVLDPGASLDITAMWDTGRNAPGSYRIVLQALDASSNQLLAERGAGIDILLTENIESVNVNVGATEQLAFTANLVNASNVTVNVVISFIRYFLLSGRTMLSC